MRTCVLYISRYQKEVNLFFSCIYISHFIFEDINN